LNDHRSLLATGAADLRTTWKALALTDIAYKIIALIVLTPLVGILFRTLLAMSGRSVLADQDILHFFLGPVGWVCFVLVGALWLGIVAIEQAALMGILAAAAAAKRVTVLGALRFAGAHAWPVVRLTARLAAFTLLAIAPLLVVAGLVYVALLTQYDINFYLKEKPPVFWVAVGLGGVIVAALVAVLLYLVSSWFFTLPLVLFEGVSPAKSLRASRARAAGHRPRLLLWIALWVVASVVLSTIATSAVLFLGQFLIPRATGSVELLLAAIGSMLILWASVNLVVNLLTTTTFAAILFGLYRHFGLPGDLDLTRLKHVEPTPAAAGLRLTRMRLVAATGVAILVAVAVGIVAVRSVHLEDRTAIIAHRGASKAAPENTLAAIKKAIEDKADWVEIDVQETADDKVVVFHDSDFMKLAGVDLKIWDATMDDLKDIDIGSWFAPEFKDQRVPTLDEVLDVCKGKVGVNIELKYYGHDKQLEQRVAEIVKAHDMAAEIVVMSLKIDAVKKMKLLRPNWKVGLLMSVSAGDMRTLEADFLAVNAGFANRRLVRSTHAGGKEIFVWTVNDISTMSAMVSRGVDGLITDKPALAKAVLEMRAKLSAPERLLLELAGVFGLDPEIGEQ
jgi:glycerophosphoryl diester phosphodiesterase